MVVTVLMPVHNAEATVAEAIESVLSQTHRDIDFLIVDDGSMDRSIDIIRRYQQSDERIRVVSQAHRGMGEALNYGLRDTGAEWVVRMDADDVMLPSRIERQIDFVTRNPDLSIAGCLVYYIDARGRQLGRSYSDLGSIDDLSRYLASNRPIGLHHPAVIYRRSKILEAGGYRPEFWPAEDIDLWNRVAERGAVILVQQEYLLKYRIHSGSVSIASAWKARQMYRWVRDCMCRRRQGLPELQLEEFLAFEQSQPLLTRLNRSRKEMAKVMYKGAAHSYSRRRFHGAIAHLLLSVALEPSYPIKQVSRKLTLF